MINPPQSPAAAHCIAKLIRLDPGLYAMSIATSDENRIEQRCPRAVWLSPLPIDAPSIEIIDDIGRAAAWLRSPGRMLFVRASAAAGLLAMAYHDAAGDSAPLRLEIRRIAAPDNTVGATAGEAQIVSLGAETTSDAASSGRPVDLEVVAHIRRRGDVRFADPMRIGRLGAGLWLEALTVLPADPALPLEYKGLAASGVETPWVGCGSPCGSRGQGTPLIGFAMRQRAGTGALFDCTYTGYFASGQVVGPARNGAPCRSTVSNDPLEGLELRIVAR